MGQHIHEKSLGVLAKNLDYEMWYRYRSMHQVYTTITSEKAREKLQSGFKI